MAPLRALLDRERLVRLRRPARRLALALAACGLAWAAAHTAVDRAPVRALVREKASAALASRLPGAVMGDEVSIDWLFRASVGPITVPARARGAPPVIGVEKVKVRLSWLALLAGRAEPASIRLYGVRLVPGPEGRELLDLAARLRKAPRGPAAAGPAPSPRADPVLHVRGLTAEIEVGARRLVVGPVDLRLERTREAAAERVAVEVGFHGGGHAEATLRRVLGADAPPAAARPGGAPPKGAAGGPAAAPAPAGPPAWSLSGHLRATPADLPPALTRRAVTASGGSLRLEVEAAATPSGASLRLRGAVADLVLRGAPLGPEPVGPLHLAGEAELEGSLAERTVRLRRGVLRPAGPLVVEATGALTAAGDLPFQLEVKAAPVDYGALVAALPAALAPGPDAPRPAGAVGGALSASGAARLPETWVVKAEVDLDGLREAARRGPPSPLRAPFTARPAGEEGPAVLLGPASRDFVPIAELPEHVVRAVTTSEDAGFFAHRGFDFDELRNALVAGVRAGQLRRGGSTITQQLAKNLFLSRDRTLARKAREALVTVALEGTVPKARLLEIYLNLIEWGPGLHGIGPAARHYLGKDPRALTPREACFLATLIPSPLRSHAALAAGVPVERWSERVDDLLRKLAASGVLDEETLERELAAPLALAGWVPGDGPGAAGDAPASGPDDGPEEAPPAGGPADEAAPAGDAPSAR